MGTAGGQDKEGCREGKLAAAAPFLGSSMVSGSGFSLWLSSSGLGAGSSRTSRTGRGGWPDSSGFRFGDLSRFPLGAIVTSSYAGSWPFRPPHPRASSAPVTSLQPEAHDRRVSGARYCPRDSAPPTRTSSARSSRQAGKTQALAQALHILRLLQEQSVSEPIHVIFRPRRRVAAPQAAMGSK